MSNKPIYGVNWWYKDDQILGMPEFKYLAYHIESKQTWYKRIYCVNEKVFLELLADWNDAKLGWIYGPGIIKEIEE